MHSPEQKATSFHLFFSYFTKNHFLLEMKQVYRIMFRNFPLEGNWFLKWCNFLAAFPLQLWNICLSAPQDYHTPRFRHILWQYFYHTAEAEEVYYKLESSFSFLKVILLKYWPQLKLQNVLVIKISIDGGILCCIYSHPSIFCFINIAKYLQ